MVVETPRKRPSSTARSTRSAPVISSLAALVASGIRTARKTLASRQVSGPPSTPLIFPSLFELPVHAAEVVRRQATARQPEGLRQAGRDRMHAERAVGLLDKHQEIPDFGLQRLADLAGHRDLILGSYLRDRRHEAPLIFQGMSDERKCVRESVRCQALDSAGCKLEGTALKRAAS